ncbi:hypothetical protein DMH04_10205 [Kibdelosporangium aridum]|uniref:Uncharacterized protein n=1 Tax=Kibdelosporangium aridum TaxID=2030 RepID=A0A428ZH68_KIBAR|nr:hypothetical protein [Kibdelosporangium aridum]RSM87404.1 hypothetical protein DMH04_10205 [Kibdelosporangium aridum]
MTTHQAVFLLVGLAAILVATRLAGMVARRLQLGILTTQLYSMLVVMALVTTAMTGPVLKPVGTQAQASTGRGAGHFAGVTYPH